MTAHEPILRAFGGGPLKGDKALRWAHIDEAGISKHEKVAVVAGILTEPDKHYHALAAKLREIEQTVPEPLRRGGLIFHAKDIWHGNKQFDKDLWLEHGWDKERRRSLVLRLCEIPVEFGLPVVMGMAEKEDKGWDLVIKSGLVKNFTADRGYYAISFLLCCIMLEAFMREQVEPSEVAHIVAEDTHEMREHARWAYDLANSPFSGWTGMHRAFMPFERVVEDPMFSAKTRSSLLQIADSIAFVTSRHFGGHADVFECFEAFFPQIIAPNPDFEPQGEVK